MSTFYINDWCVDVGANRLSLGQTQIKIEAKTMEVLAYLANRPGEIVTREELERDVWTGKVVGYDSLTSIITKLRKALDDDSRQPRYIETISKKGYRLIASVNIEPTHCSVGNKDSNTTTPSASTQHRRAKPAWIVFGTAIALLLTIFILEKSLPKSTQHASEELNTSVKVNNFQNTINSNIQNNTPSIAVLPFSDLSEHATHSYLSEGITEDITTALSKLSGLFVIAKSSTQIYKNQTVDVIYVATQLNVRYVLDGSVRQAGSKLRVNAKLIDGRNGILLWGESYDREMKHIFDVQDDITLNIVNALSVKLTEEEKRRTAKKYTVSIDAYDEFLRGQVFYANHTREDNLSARESYLKSIDMDANFARAYSALALTYSAEFRYGWHSDADESLRQAAKLAQKAVSIDNQLPNAFWVLGYVNLHQQKYKQAIEAANKAISLNPNYADGYATLGVSYIYDGNPEKGAQMMRRAMRLSPQYPAAYASGLGQAYYFLRQYENALAPLQDAVERNVNLRTSHVYLIASLSHIGKDDEASWAAIQLRTIDPEFSVEDVSDMFPIKDNERLQEIKKHLRRAGL